MSYVSLDVYSEKTKADTAAQVFRQSGRKEVKVLEMNKMIVTDCRGDAPMVISSFDSPLFIVVSEG